jgi:autotransporter translocation and assembly factor TamB
MSNVTRTTTERAIEHPLEEVFDIESGTTLMPQVTRSTELVVADQYDDKDTEIEQQFQEVYDAGMSAFEQQFSEADMVEGKYKARAGEVAVQFLNTALAAAQAKSNLKMHKDKITATALKNSKPNTVNNNLVVATQAEILRRLMGRSNDDEEPVNETSGG